MKTPEVFCSTIIPTIGRASLGRAVRSVLDQQLSGVQWEVLVVNDTGEELLPFDGMDHPTVQIVTIQKRRMIVGRNVGAAVARGRYLHFLDDDDWMLPGAFAGAFAEAWRLAQEQPEAAVIYGGIQLVDVNDSILGRLNLGCSGNCASQLLAGSWIPIGSVFVRREPYFEIGGFNTRLQTAEELDLFRQIALRYFLVNSTVLFANILRGQGWSTSAIHDSAEENRKSREAVLATPGVFRRLMDSAEDDYFKGRICQAYGASLRWNLQEGQILTATSRALFGLRALLASGRAVFSRQFWQAIVDTQVPCTFARMQEAQREQASR